MATAKQRLEAEARYLKTQAGLVSSMPEDVQPNQTAEALYRTGEAILLGLVVLVEALENVAASIPQARP